MAKPLNSTRKAMSTPKRTSQGNHKLIKRSSMNKSKKRCFKRYRGQGR